MSYILWHPDTFKDKDCIIKFWNDNQHKLLNNKYRWIYEGNPDGIAKVLMVKHVESGEIAGMLSLFPRMFIIKSKRIKAGIIGDLIVNKNHRTLGPALQLFKEAIIHVENGNFDFLYGFPNKNAEPVLKRAGYFKLGQEVKYIKIIRSKTQLKKKHVPNLILPFASSVADCFLHFISLENRYPISRSLDGKEITFVDNSIDKFFNECQCITPITGERSANYVSWKFFKDPDDKHSIFILNSKEDSSIKGYISFRTDALYIDIRDIVSSDEYVYVLITLFIRFVKLFFSDGITVTFLENNSFLPVLNRFGFRKGKYGRNIYLYYSKNNALLDDTLLNSHNWHLFSSEQDT